MNIAYDLVFILAGAFVGGFVAKMLKLPLIVGYLFVGVIFSWFLSKFINVSDIENIATLGVTLLMFTLGLEFSLRRMRKVGEIILLGSLLQVLLVIIFGIFFFPILGFNFYNSLFLGCVFSLSSTGIVVKILSDKGELDTLNGEIAIGWLLVQDLVTLPMIIILPTIGEAILSGGGLWFNILSVLKAVSLSFALLILIVLLGRKVIPHIMNKIAQIGVRELLLIAVIVICLLFSVGASTLGFSFAIGAFVAGFLISSTSSNHAIFAEVRPLRDIFSIVFFISLGLLLNPVFVSTNLIYILALTIFIIVLKFVVSSFLVLFLGYHTRTAFSVGVSLISTGELAFILGKIGMDHNLISNSTYMTILSVTILSMAISSPLLLSVDKIYLGLRRILKKYIPYSVHLFKRFDEQMGQEEVLKTNHAVVLGHGRVGKYISKVLFRSKIPYIVVDYNNHIITNLKQEGIDVIYGDPSEIDVLIKANIGSARAVIIAIPDRHTQDMVISHLRELNPNVKIICRSHYEEDEVKLRDLGVDVVQPEFEAAVSIIYRLLYLFNVPSNVIDSTIGKLKGEHGF